MPALGKDNYNHDYRLTMIASFLTRSTQVSLALSLLLIPNTTAEDAPLMGRQLPLNSYQPN